MMTRNNFYVINFIVVWLFYDNTYVYDYISLTDFRVNVVIFVVNAPLNNIGVVICGENSILLLCVVHIDQAENFINFVYVYCLEVM